MLEDIKIMIRLVRKNWSDKRKIIQVKKEIETRPYILYSANNI